MKESGQSDGMEACLALSNEGWEFTIVERDNLYVTVTIEHPEAQFGPLVTEFPPVSLESALVYAAQIAGSLDGP